MNNQLTAKGVGPPDRPNTTHLAFLSRYEKKKAETSHIKRVLGKMNSLYYANCRAELTVSQYD